MAFCTNCGLIMHHDDMGAHVKNGCNLSDIPEKGKPKKPTTTEITVVQP